MSTLDSLSPGDLVLVSNRLPYTVGVSQGSVTLTPSTGGLATSMRPLLEKGVALWFGWPGLSEEQAGDAKDEINRQLRTRGVVPVWLKAEEVENYYEGFCNATIWPLFHYFADKAVFNERYWDAYVRVNERFAEEIASRYPRGAIIWVHDYHLMLLPSMLRERLGDDVPIGFFLHIPFPNFEVFRQLPWRAEVLKGLLGADLIGFHTYDYMNYFLQSVSRILGLEQELNVIKYGDRLVKVDVFPIGVDFTGLRKMALSDDVMRKVEEFRKRLGGVKVIFSIDRLDYTKGLPERLRAFRRFLDKYPEFRGKVSYVFVVSPSRERVEEYARLRREINELVGEINGLYSTLSWTPVIYIRRFMPNDELLALYRLASVALVTPLRDGMNLVAKEYIAANVDRNGFLIVSEGAGAASELVEAIIVNPYNYDQVADAIKTALTLSAPERQRRLSALETRVSSYDVMAWASDFIESLKGFKKYQLDSAGEMSRRRLAGAALSMVMSSFNVSSKRILFLDYDGTLAPFAPLPSLAEPDPELISLLKSLASLPNTKVVIITSRSKVSIERLLPIQEIDIAAENGAWVREKGTWKNMVTTKDLRWKDEVVKLFSVYVKRTPGSFIEQKDYSIAWHYRNAPESLGEGRASELMDVLSRFVAIYPELSVVRLPKTIEVRLAELSKARAARYWLDRDKYDFVLAAGDSGDDESLFASLPPDSVTVKVGSGPTRAKYYVRSPMELRDALKKLSGVSH